MKYENATAISEFRLEEKPADDRDSLSDEEVIQLRSLLKVLRFDPVQKAVVIKNGQSRIVAREDGTIRIEGKTVTASAQRAVRINGAIVELN